MFLSRDAFDQNNGGSQASRPGTSTGAYRPSSGGGLQGRHGSGQSRPNTGGDVLGSGDAAGEDGAALSRKGMLERQRALALQRQRERMGGAAFTSRNDRPDPQFTPGVRTFSSPRQEAPDSARPPTGRSMFSGGSGPSHGQSSTTAMSTGRSEPMFSSRSERLSSEDLSAGVGEVSPVSVTAGGGGGGGGGVETMTHRDQPPRQATGVSELIERKRHDTEIAVASSPRTAGTAAARADMVAKSGLSTTYDPTDSAARMDSPMKVIAAAARGHEDQVKLDLSDMKTFLTTPLPRGYGTLQCYIERDKSGFSRRMYPEYRLYMKDEDRFLMASKKRSKQKTSNYIISRNEKNLDRNSEYYMGKLRSNFVGTEFLVFDDGENPTDKKVKRGAAKARTELGVVQYASNVLGSRGPRKMKVAVPKLRADGTMNTVCPATEEESIATKFRHGHTHDLFLMINKPPKWNDQVSAYVLNFNGRVTMASVKNFQLVSPEDQERVVLQFGRVSKDLFTMDFQWPLTPAQAFAICLSSFDYKLACE